MNRGPNRKRLRRAYLRKKAKAYGTLVFIVVASFALALLNALYFPLPQGGVRAALQGLVAAILFRVVYPFYKRKQEAAQQITYFPPVQRSTLPTNEVQVRGTAEPSAPSATLLRTTVNSEETQAEKLLRSASVSIGEQNR